MTRPPQSPLVDPAYEKEAALLGATPDEIHQKFAAIQELNFSQGDTQQVVSRLSDTELHDLAYLYDRSAPTGSSTLLRTFARRLDGASLVRIAKAFGSDATQAAVQTYANPQVQADFAQRLDASQGVPLTAPSSMTYPMGEGSGEIDGDSVPDIAMTLEEIYLDFRTAPVGGISAAASISETTLFAGGVLHDAWEAGYDFGTGIHELIEEYDPALDDVIGGTIQQAVDNIADAYNEWGQGSWESWADDLFGGPIAGTGDYSGDWNVGESYDYYESGSGGCS